MQKQRSPYTGGGGGGGGFNVQQLKEPSFGQHSCPSGMPLLAQLKQQVKHTVNAGPSLSCNLPPLNVLGGGFERGLRSGTPRGFMSSGSFNGSYEGEIPPLSLPLPGGSDDMMQCGEPNLLKPSISMSRQMPMPMSAQAQSYNSETDSDSEYTQHKTSFGSKHELRSRRICDNLKSCLNAQQQQRMETALQRCAQSKLLSHVLLLLHLLAVLIGATVAYTRRAGLTVSQLSLRLWRCKFQLRSLLRQLLWRMANAKGNDVLIFLCILIVTPWVFLLGLAGFLISFVFSLK
ncbi:CG12035 [Drosophila busckii]|uniref:CG12035 n=2 Tax=Drosophila busckii TaxID=30019 RepID=A0A0M4F0T7_DROBS|nr:CG12035 [Drosophila busckii]